MSESGPEPPRTPLASAQRLKTGIAANAGNRLKSGPHESCRFRLTFKLSPLESMILEIATLQVRPGRSAEFEAAFQRAQAIISSMPGYISHELQRCIERKDAYVLLVRWRALEDHEVGFRQSPQYQEWKSLLHHFYDPFPGVLHYENVLGAEA